MDAVVGQDLSEEFLNVVVCPASDDGSNEFDFDADFSIEIDFAFHTQVYRAVLKAQVESPFCLSLFLPTISAKTLCLVLASLQKMGMCEATCAASADRIC